MANEILAGQTVYIEGRPDKNKDGWMASNGIITAVFDDNGDQKWDAEDVDEWEPYEIMVKFSEGDSDMFFVSEFEWTDSYGGTWIKV